MGFEKAAATAALVAAMLVGAAFAAPANAAMAPPKNEAELDRLADEGRVAEAIAALERYVRAHPQHDPQRFLLARAYLENGEPEKAAEQYQFIAAHSAFPNSRDRAKQELAKYEAGELPTIPVKDPTPPPASAPVARPKDDPGFPKEKTDVAAEAFAGTGYDSNANAGSNADRFFFYTLTQEQRRSPSAYGMIGGNGAGSYAFSDTLALRGAVGGAARTNWAAHYADTRDLSAQAQLRWAGPQQRFSGGLVYSHSWFGHDELNHALAATTRLELMTRAMLVTIQMESARIRYPYEPLRDVDTFFIRSEVLPAPSKEAKWSPGIIVFTGFEEETHDESPFGRHAWGLTPSLARRLGGGFSIEGEASYTKSMFDATFGGSERRSDDYKGWGLFGHYSPGEKSRWTHSLGGRYQRTDSSSPVFDYVRYSIGYELSVVFGREDDE